MLVVTNARVRRCSNAIKSKPLIWYRNYTAVICQLVAVANPSTVVNPLFQNFHPHHVFGMILYVQSGCFPPVPPAVAASVPSAVKLYKTRASFKRMSRVPTPVSLQTPEEENISRSNRGADCNFIMDRDPRFWFPSPYNTLRTSATLVRSGRCS